VTSRPRIRSLLLSALLSFAIVYLLACGSVEWRSAAIRNQSKVVSLLAHARLEGGAGDAIRRVKLADQVFLLADRTEIVSGYALTAHVHSLSFTIEAHPVEHGTTGVLSYFLDDSGIVHFETGQKQASALSRPLGPASPERNQ